VNPFSALWRAFVLALTGRLHFVREAVGELVVVDGQTFRVFRQVTVDPRPPQPDSPAAIFVPRFEVAGMSPAVNTVFSLVPMLFILGMPGLRSKAWLVDDVTREYAGFYEWDTRQDAESYAHSYAARFMTRRSVPGSVSFRVFDRSDALPISWPGRGRIETVCRPSWL
jgi:hypothetical protein